MLEHLEQNSIFSAEEEIRVFVEDATVEGLIADEVAFGGFGWYFGGQEGFGKLLELYDLGTINVKK